MLNVALFFGGRSTEHDVSIISAVQAMNYFDTEEYLIFPIYISKDNEFYYSPLFRNVGAVKSYKEDPSVQRVVFLKTNGKVKMVNFHYETGREEVISELDVAFPIVHGTNVEDGILQGFLKTLDIPFVGCDVLSSAIGMDKYVMKVFLKAEGYPVLRAKKYSSYNFPNIEEILINIEEEFKYPVIVKPVNLGSSIGISKAYNSTELRGSLANAFKYSDKVLVEKAIQNLKEVNCSVLGNAYECIVSECEEPITNHEVLDFEEKYIAGSKSNGSKGLESLHRRIPADISDKTRADIQKISLSVFKCLECNGVTRLDYMIDLDTNELWLNEINTIPGSLAFYLWEKSGISYSQLLDRLIKLAINRFEEEKSINYNFDSSILDSVSLSGVKGCKASESDDLVEIII